MDKLEVRPRTGGGLGNPFVLGREVRGVHRPYCARRWHAGAIRTAFFDEIRLGATFRCERNRNAGSEEE